ncbi:MAG TPA: maleylpyruvate isomerase N-terminal domain-containing protein [Thermomicrobiales bacterium]|nr:maleylpyruvate isomerase N-terminal domain-containing protein [Thermomicrobiales bacterium]
MKTRADLLDHIRREHAAWRALLAEVGEDRMEEPGPMGDWTFKDLAAHLLFWNERTIARIEAGPGGRIPFPWPASFGDEDEIEDWDEVNAWIYEQHRQLPLRDVLADKDRQYERFEQLIEALPDDALLTPGHFEWMGGRALVEAQFFGHLHEEHMPSIQAWLASR